MRREVLEVLGQLLRLGISLEDGNKMRHIAGTLRRWAEWECNGEIERDDETGKPYVVFLSYPQSKWPTADREKGALKRLAKLLEGYPDLAAYHQTDPRGVSLFIYRKADLKDGRKIDCCYSTIGTAVY